VLSFIKNIILQRYQAYLKNIYYKDRQDLFEIILLIDHSAKPINDLNWKA